MLDYTAQGEVELISRSCRTVIFSKTKVIYVLLWPGEQARLHKKRVWGQKSFTGHQRYDFNSISCINLLMYFPGYLLVKHWKRFANYAFSNNTWSKWLSCAKTIIKLRGGAKSWHLIATHAKCVTDLYARTAQQLKSRGLNGEQN